MVWNFNRLLAECLGTFGLVLVGTGAIVLNDALNDSITHFGISLAFGGIVTLMILIFGKTSGAHINPAVTIGFWIGKHFPKNEVIPYCMAQIVGACLASFALFLVFNDHPNLGATFPKAGVWSTFGLEFALTFALMFVILVFSQGPKHLNRFTAWLVGGTVGLEAFFAGPFTGASMNPARSLAPALFSGHLPHLWIYLIATSLGAIAAALLWVFNQNRIYK